MVVHGSVVLFLLGLIGEQAVVKAPVIELTEVEVVKPPPPPPPVPATSGRAPAAPKASKPGRGQTPRGHSVTQAPPVDDPLADIAVSYDKPGPAEGRGAASGLGALVSANRGAGGGGTGGAGTGTGSGTMQPHGPRPKHGYPESKVAAVRRYAGSRIEAELTIDARGRVVGVRVISGVDPKVDERVTAIAKKFEFEPAHDEHGKPCEGQVRWTFVIVEGNTDDEDEDKPFMWRPAHPIF